MTKRTIGEVLRRHTPEWMTIPGVVGTAIGERGGKPCILVMVARKTEDIAERIPGTAESFPVFIEEVGAIRSRDR